MRRPLPVRTASSALLLALALVSIGCGSGSSSADSGTSAETLCERDTRGEAFMPGLEKVDGALHVKILEGTPSVPVKGNNTWTVELRDGAGAVVDGATVSATPFMPDHNHGTSVVPTITALGEGRYTISPLYLFMAGVWRITLQVTPPGPTPTPASVQFFFCIDG